MTTFYEMDHNLKFVILLLIFVLHFCQYAYLILLFHYREKYRGYLNLLPTAFVFFFFLFLTRSQDSPYGIFGDLPAAGIILVWALLAIHTITGIIRQIKKGRQMLTSQSIREAADNLPSGLVYFSENGLIVLCNKRMQELFYQMTGHDLQMMQELEEAIVNHAKKKEDGAVILSNGTIWKFEKSEISVGSRQKYTQYTAADLTELYRIREKTDRDNEKMQVMIQQVQNITKNIADITRQEEILTAKMRVHNKMGNCMLAVRRYISENTLETSHHEERKRNLIQLWEESLQELKNEVGACDYPDAYESVVQIADSIGLQVILHGSLPENQKTAYLLVAALRECVTNAVNHAKATRIDLTVSVSGTNICALYKNNGKPPEEEIKEGGGLSSLRKKIETSGGQMEVSSRPIFMLKITIPEMETEEAERNDFSVG